MGEEDEEEEAKGPVLMGPGLQDVPEDMLLAGGWMGYRMGYRVG